MRFWRGQRGQKESEIVNEREIFKDRAWWIGDEWVGLGWEKTSKQLVYTSIFLFRYNRYGCSNRGEGRQTVGDLNSGGQRKSFQLFATSQHLFNCLC